jgi:hypothetical protein
MELTRYGKPDDAALAKLMRVRTFSEPAEYLNAAVRNLWDALAKSAAPIAMREADRMTQVDGTIYQLRPTGDLDTLSIEFAGSEVGVPNAGEWPLVRWTNGLRNDFEARLDRE